MPESSRKRAIVIGGGIGGLGIAALLAKKGYDVTLLEKNPRLGGRANVFEADGFRFDMGPSWYLMPDIWEHWFTLMGEAVGDWLPLQRLDPSYRIVFRGDGEVVDMHSDIDRDALTFEAHEAGAAARLRDYLGRSAYQYKIAIQGFLFKNYDTVFDFFNRYTMVEGRKLHVFEKMHQYVARFFTSEKLQQIIEYQMVFLGSSPYATPALYNILNHVDFEMGVWYPKGGIYAIVEALVGVGRKYGAEFRTDAGVAQILVENGRATGVKLESGEVVAADLVVSNADIHHTDMKLLPPEARERSESYWKSRKLAPSAFILYLGVRGELPQLAHHTLVFPPNWKTKFDEIFDTPRWPDEPSYYICRPSATDDGVAPAGFQNVFVLVPVAAGLTLTPDEETAYGNKILRLIAKDIGVPDLPERIVFRRAYTGKDFARDYNSYGGSALGLAHTMMQTAIFRPNNISKKVSNLYFVGANTNPGIGMPICLVSAEMAYKRIEGIKTAAPLDRL